MEEAEELAAELHSPARALLVSSSLPPPHATAAAANLTTAAVANITTDFDPYVFFKEVQFTLLGLLLVAIIVGNTSVIVALLFTKARKSRMNFFIMQLAIADLLVGLIYVTADIIQKVTIEWYAGEFLCKLFKFLQGVVLYASTYVLVALSVDRCDAITNPMNFSGSWNRARALVASAWVVSILCSIPLLILPETRIVSDKMQCWIELQPSGWKVWVTTVAVTILLLPTVTITACYTIIVLTIWTKSKAVVMTPSVNNSRKAKTHKNGNADGEPESRRASSRGLIPRAKIKSVKMSFVIVFVFILCWSPYIVFDMLQVYECINMSQNIVAWATLIQSLAPLNSAANPLICCLFSPHIYTGLRRIPPYSWCWRFRGGGSRGTLRSRSDSTAYSDLLNFTHYWCWRFRGGGSRGTLRSRSDSTAHSDLLSSTHVRRTQKAASMLNMMRRGSSATRGGDGRSSRLQLASASAPRD